MTEHNNGIDSVSNEKTQNTPMESPSKQDGEPPHIVVCSDGTWNQGGPVNPTNVWRTYKAVEPENQVKFHDNGVGSEGIRLIQIVGGAFGYGISQNLRDLLAFVIQSYQPGAKIYLFGFSRGAFTVRVLADIICMFGIPDKTILGTTDLIEEATTELLRLYKKEKSMLHSEARKLAKEKKIKLHELDEKELQGSDQVKQKSKVEEFRAKYRCAEGSPDDEGNVHAIHFLGIWDTVEALGVPFEPLKRVATYFFPLRFRNNVPSSKIKNVCHALSLDDERRAFHPLVVEDREVPGQTIHQTWFPGNHCHVGGGYTRDQMAMIPLKWMLDHAKNAGLKINMELYDEYDSDRNSHGQLPHSRSGTNFFYCYHPRRIDDFQTKGPWSIHVSAFHRLGNQIQTYLPVAMVVDKSHIEKQHGIDCEDSPQIFIDGGGVPLDLDQREYLIPESVCTSENRDYINAISNLHKRQIWIGTALWHLCVALAISFVLFGFLNRFSNFAPASTLFLPFSSSVSWPSALGGVELLGLETIKTFSPEFIYNYVFAGFERRPGSLLNFAVFALILILACIRNRRIVEAKTFDAWEKTEVMAFYHRRRTDLEPLQGASTVSILFYPIKVTCDLVLKTLAKFSNPIRSTIHQLVFQMERGFTWIFKTKTRSYIIAGLLCIPLAILGYTQLSYSYVYSSVISKGEEEAIRLSVTTGLELQPFEHQVDDFKASDVVFSTNIQVKSGEKYNISLSQFEKDWKDWQDWNIEASPSGFKKRSKEKWFMQPRRDPSLPVFQVLAKIEPNGQIFAIGEGGEITADSDGLLVLFVNDVRGFYGNNKGRANVGVTRKR